MRRATLVLSLLSALLLQAGAPTWASAQASFSVLETNSQVGIALSADGHTIGTSSNRSISPGTEIVEGTARLRDRLSGEIVVELHDPTGWIGPFIPSGDGMVARGAAAGSAPSGFLYRRASDLLTDLGNLPTFQNFFPQALDHDGGVTVGTWNSSPYKYSPFPLQDPVFLGSLPGGTGRGDATDVSAAGDVVVGWSRSGDSEFEAFRWEDGAMTSLGDLPGGNVASWAWSISADASTIVGWTSTDPGSTPFRWRDGVMNPLPVLSGGRYGGSALGTSGDGGTVVGWSFGEGDRAQAVLWDESGEIHDLEVLFGTLGLDLGGLSLDRATGVSDDGRVIVGLGTLDEHTEFAWVATIPEPGTGCLLGIGLLCLARPSRGSRAARRIS